MPDYPELEMDDGPEDDEPVTVERHGGPFEEPEPEGYGPCANCGEGGPLWQAAGGEWLCWRCGG